MSIKALYLELIERINTKCLSVNTCSVWNNQLQRIDDRDNVQFDYPAVFFEMSNIVVNQLGDNNQEMESDLIVHIIHEQYDEQFDDRNLNVFVVVQEVFEALQLFKPTKSAILVRTSQEQDFDYSNLYHFKQTYKLVTMLEKAQSTDIEVENIDLVVNKNIEIDNLIFRTGII